MLSSKKQNAPSSQISYSNSTHFHFNVSHFSTMSGTLGGKQKDCLLFHSLVGQKKKKKIPVKKKIPLEMNCLNLHLTCVSHAHVHKSYIYRHKHPYEDTVNLIQIIKCFLKNKKENKQQKLTFFLSLMEPLPRTIILQPVSASSCLAVSPRGPRILPTKLNCTERKYGI